MDKEAMQKAFMDLVQFIKLYYDTAILAGFSEDQALQLAISLQVDTLQKAGVSDMVKFIQ